MIIVSGSGQSESCALRVRAQDNRFQSIGDRLRLIRLAYGVTQGRTRGLSQTAICELAGISKQAWNNAETGDNRIGLDNAIRLCRVTGASLDYVYRGLLAGLPHELAVEIQNLETPRRV